MAGPVSDEIRTAGALALAARSAEAWAAEAPSLASPYLANPPKAMSLLMALASMVRTYVVEDASARNPGLGPAQLEAFADDALRLAMRRAMLERPE